MMAKEADITADWPNGKFTEEVPVADGWGEEFLPPKYAKAEALLAKNPWPTTEYNYEDLGWGLVEPKLPTTPFDFSEDDLACLFAEYEGMKEKEINNCTILEPLSEDLSIHPTLNERDTEEVGIIPKPY